jgi:hypothetical protein
MFLIFPLSDLTSGNTPPPEQGSRQIGFKLPAVDNDDDTTTLNITLIS